MKLASLFLFTCCAVVAWLGSGVEGQYLLDPQPKEDITQLELTPQQQSEAAAFSQLLAQQQANQHIPGNDATFMDRVRNLIAPLRQFDFREMFAGAIRRVTSMFAQTNIQGRDGRMIFNPDLDTLIHRAVDAVFDYGENYYYSR